MALNIIFTDKSNRYLLKFNLINTNSAFANAIRRTAISEVPTIGFDTENYQTSSLRVLENTSSLHNEYLLHRIGLIPINFNNSETFDIANYIFTLKVENTVFNTINVTSNDFTVLNKTTNNIEPTENFFKPDPITGDFILITKLKANPGSNGEKIHIKGTAFIGTGGYNSRFSPVSVCMFTNTIDIPKLQEGFGKLVKQKEAEKKDRLSHDEFNELQNYFKISESERFYYTDSNGDPNMFDFTIESIGIQPSANILYNTCEILIRKVKNLVRLLRSDEDTEEINIVKSDGIMEGHDIIINDETHTLGYLLQTYINNLVADNLPSISFIGYKNPNPLKKNIILRTSLNTMTIPSTDTIKNILISSINNIITDLELIQTRLSSEFSSLLSTKKVVRRIISRKPVKTK